MELIVGQVVREYGLFGLLVLFLMFAYVLQHKSCARKEDAFCKTIEKIGSETSCAVKENSRAFHAVAESHIKIADSSQNIVAGLDRLAAQTSREHGEILRRVTG